jgi:hypothetical protein
MYLYGITKFVELSVVTTPTPRTLGHLQVMRLELLRRHGEDYSAKVRQSGGGSHGQGGRLVRRDEKVKKRLHVKAIFSGSELISTVNGPC